MIEVDKINEVSEAVSTTFSAYIEKSTNEKALVSAMQYWFFALPKYVKVTTKRYQGGGYYVPLDNRILKFKDSLRKPEIEADVYLSESLPAVFGGLESFSEKLAEVKNEVESTMTDMLEGILYDISEIFHVKDTAALSQGLIDWYQSLPEQAIHHCYDRGEERLFRVIADEEPNSLAIIKNMAAALTGFAPEDFEESTPTLFVERVQEYKSVIEGLGKAKRKNTKNMYSIILNGNIVKTFTKADDISGVGKLMMNELTTLVAEYGQAITISEKRQILLDVLGTLGDPAVEPRKTLKSGETQKIGEAS